GAEVSTKDLAAMMVGREVSLGRRPDRPNGPGDVALEVSGVTVRNDFGRVTLSDASLQVREGEVVAVAGVAGNGQRELAEAVTGLRELEEGEVRIGGKRVRSGQPRDAIEHGMAYVPQDRLAVGLAPGLSIADNLILKAERDDKEIASGPILLKGRIQARTREMLERFDIRGASDAPVGSLSGGNAQKVILARELSCDPRVVVAESPTRGLDVGAIASVRRTLLEAAGRGVAILLVSEDLDEVLDLADRVAVMYGGRIVGVVEAEGADHEQLGLMMAGIAA
ncbi:MAG TPA: ATP-binding cassette domain-containing protein, partial [Conexibacter sp.]|nr:ATP-binding cassette domain-containing protein [Conexibacter sp.]